MKDIPIIFPAPMVRALLDGRKTMTRKLAWGKPIPGLYESDGGPLTPIPRRSIWQRVKVGDRLWVCESLKRDYLPNIITNEPTNAEICVYAADDEWVVDPCGFNLCWIWKQASCLSPRWASRLTLIVTATKIERLQDITDADAIAEGVTRHEQRALGYWVPGVEHPNKDFPVLSRPTAREMFAALWDVDHKPGAWLANPEVVAISFSVHEFNIDAMPKADAA